MVVKQSRAFWKRQSFTCKYIVWDDIKFMRNELNWQRESDIDSDCIENSEALFGKSQEVFSNYLHT